jgi:hypothetical protein
VDESNMTGQLESGSIHIRGHLLRIPNGSFSLNEHAIKDEISLYHSDDYRNGSNIQWDEQDNSGNAVVSYFENPVTELCRAGLPREFSRTRTPLRHANGSIFALPISYGSEQRTKRAVDGLVLYQPPHQFDVFHRVGSYETNSSLDLAVSFEDRFNSQYPARSICII